jgi:membrane protease YdiL (CAAX protease family)
MSCPVEFRNKRTGDFWNLICVGGCVWFFSSIIVFEIFRPFFSPKEWEDLYIFGAKLLQALCLGSFIVLIGIDVPRVIHDWLKQWREHLHIVNKYFAVYVGGLLAVLAIGVIIFILLEKIGRIDLAVMETVDDIANSNNKILHLKQLFQTSIPLFILSLGTICVLAPIIEEIFFRRFLFVALRKNMDFIWALLISAILFMLVHRNIAQGAIGGIYLGYVYEKGKSLPANILIHGMVNLLSLL